MTKNNIKTDDLCERCEYGQCSGQTEACVVDRLCPLYSVFGCRCEQIRQNTPCPFFRDQEEDRETGKMSKMKKVPETGKNARITFEIRLPEKNTKEWLHRFHEKVQDALMDVFLEEAVLPINGVRIERMQGGARDG